MRGQSDWSKNWNFTTKIGEYVAPRMVRNLRGFDSNSRPAVIKKEKRKKEEKREKKPAARRPQRGDF